MLRIILLFTLTLVSGLLKAQPEIKGSPEELRGFLHPQDNIVTIRAEAEEKAYSDKAIISLIVTTEDKLLSSAISQNSRLREQITQSFISFGINAQDVNSSKFSSSPQFGWFGDTPKSYKVVNRVAVTITSEAHLEQIAVVADQHTEVELTDTAFEHTKKDEFNRKVKAKALEKVLEQKAFYEKSLNIKLKPIGIRKSDVRQRATRGADVLQEMIVVNSIRAKGSYSSEPKPSRSDSFDEVNYQADLTVDFKIEE